MTIESLILFTDHMVVCEPRPEWDASVAAEYVHEVALCLRPEGSIREHAAELRQLGADVTWTFSKLKTLTFSRVYSG